MPQTNKTNNKYYKWTLAALIVSGLLRGRFPGPFGEGCQGRNHRSNRHGHRHPNGRKWLAFRWKSMITQRLKISRTFFRHLQRTEPGPRQRFGQNASRRSHFHYRHIGL